MIAALLVFTILNFLVLVSINQNLQRLLNLAMVQRLRGDR